jgi:hypothetical protein
MAVDDLSDVVAGLVSVKRSRARERCGQRLAGMDANEVPQILRGAVAV